MVSKMFDGPTWTLARLIMGGHLEDIEEKRREKSRTRISVRLSCNIISHLSRNSEALE